MRQTSQRAGTYQQQPEGYQAFMPNPLPPQPPVAFESGLRDLLMNACLAHGRLDGSIYTLPGNNLFIAMCARKEAVMSSQIEGVQASLSDLLAVEARIEDKERPKDVHEIVNYVDALNHGLRLTEAEEGVSVQTLRDIHERLMRNVRGNAAAPGQVRSKQNWIGLSMNIREATFVPPPPSQVPRLLEDLERFMRARDDTLPFLVNIALAHAQFETIHPFLDGNGRVGRLLITLLLSQEGALPPTPTLYLSPYFKRHRGEYYDRLQAVRDDGDWEGWLTFFLQGVRETGKETVRTIRRLMALREAHRDIIDAHFGRAAASGHRILNTLYRKPIISVKDAMEATGATHASANTLVMRMTEHAILRQMTAQKRNRRFCYEEYVRLFDNER